MDYTEPSSHNKKNDSETYDKMEEESPDGLLISLITISSILIVFLLVAITFMCYKHKYCDSKYKYTCKNKNKTSPDEKKDEIKNGPDIESGEILSKQQNFQNNKNLFKIEKKKIINIQGNQSNPKSPKMVVREKIKVLHTLTKKNKPNLIKERPKASEVPIRKMKSELVKRIPQATIRKIKSEVVKDKPKISAPQIKGNKLLLLTESPKQGKD